jgi:hypothetical protein
MWNLSGGGSDAMEALAEKMFILRSITPANARILRGTIHARRIKEMSPEAKAAGAERLRIYRESALATEAVGSDK